MLLFLTDQYGNIVHVSNDFTALAGYTPEDLVGKDWDNLIVSNEETQESDSSDDLGVAERISIKTRSGSSLSLPLIIIPEFLQGRCVGYSISVRWPEFSSASSVPFSKHIKSALLASRDIYMRSGAGASNEFSDKKSPIYDESTQNGCNVVCLSIEGIRKDLECRLDAINLSASIAMQTANNFACLYPGFQKISKEISDLMQHTTQATQELNEILTKARRDGGGSYLLEADSLIVSLELALKKLIDAISSAIRHSEKNLNARFRGDDQRKDVRSYLKLEMKNNIFPIRSVASKHEDKKDDF